MLRDVNVRLPVGARSAVGPSGSGKSIMLRLLDRLADPDDGLVIYETEFANATRSRCAGR